MLHVRNIKDDKVYSGEVYESGRDNEFPIEPPEEVQEIERSRREAAIAEAQQYSDAELDEGQSGMVYLNVDALRYVDIPIVSGRYEIFFSKSGLESNHCFVDIVIE